MQEEDRRNGPMLLPDDSDDGTDGAVFPPSNAPAPRRRTWSSFFAKVAAAASVVPAIVIHLSAIIFSSGAALQLYSDGRQIAAVAVAVCVALGVIGSAVLVSMNKPTGCSTTCRFLGKQSSGLLKFCVVLAGGGLFAAIDAMATMIDSAEAEAVGAAEMRRRSALDVPRWYAASVMKSERDDLWKDWAAFLDPTRLSKYRAVREAVFGSSDVDAAQQHVQGTSALPQRSDKQASSGAPHGSAAAPTMSFVGSLIRRCKDRLFRTEVMTLGLFSAWCPQYSLAVKGFYANAVAAIPCALLLTFFLGSTNPTSGGLAPSDDHSAWYSSLNTAITSAAVSLFPTGSAEAESPLAAVLSAAIISNSASVAVAAAPIAAGLMTSSVAAAILSAALPVLDVTSAVYGLATLSIALPQNTHPLTVLNLMNVSDVTSRVGEMMSGSLSGLGMPSLLSLVLMVRFGSLCMVVLIPCAVGTFLLVVDIARKIMGRRIRFVQIILVILLAVVVLILTGPTLCALYAVGLGTLPLFVLVDRTASLNPVLFMHLCTFGRLGVATSVQRPSDTNAPGVNHEFPRGGNSTQAADSDVSRARFSTRSAARLTTPSVLRDLLMAVRSVATATKAETPSAGSDPTSSPYQRRQCTASCDRCTDIQSFSDRALARSTPTGTSTAGDKASDRTEAEATSAGATSEGDNERSTPGTVDPSLITTAAPAFVQAFQLCSQMRHFSSSESPAAGQARRLQQRFPMLKRTAVISASMYAVSQVTGFLLPGIGLLLNVVSPSLSSASGNVNTIDVLGQSFVFSHATFVQQAMLSAWLASAIIAALCAPFAWRSVALACMVQPAAPCSRIPDSSKRAIASPVVQSASIAETVLPHSADVVRPLLAHDAVPCLIADFVVLPFLPPHCVSFEELSLSECSALK